ncbi:nuclear transport factor 2 family protein [Nocardia sp. CS682]|uniref:nuclear transport factor 2 family protein n=1 Tax=Nocardia sp. CS682 TaxID=1047172 RepID=UPI001074EC34|nr:nuclear transport factor 2 family protein [Nocardia sp. CS682]QBS39677.1 nuclear transport factor 2 family protein [Nocardia sp. CS682]
MSEISTLADRLAIIDVITRLFVYTDQGRWDDLATVVFTPKVDFDGGFGGPVGERAAADIVEDWRVGLADLDAVHHQSGNHLIELAGDTATVHADAIAVHVKNSATNGKTRTFVGSYALGTERTPGGWRVNRFHYQLKVVDGNADLT